MHHVTKYCNVIGAHCTVRRDKVCIRCSPYPSPSCGSESGPRDQSCVATPRSAKEGRDLVTSFTAVCCPALWSVGRTNHSAVFCHMSAVINFNKLQGVNQL